MKNLLSLKIFTALIFTLILNSNSFSQLNGTYTIGSGGDYCTITFAINDLNIIGVNVPVIFNILSGSYNESVTIGHVPGSSSVNTIKIKSQSNNASDVIWFSDSSGIDYTLKIKGSQFLTIQYITFSYDKYERIVFENICNNIRILNNVFNERIK